MIVKFRVNLGSIDAAQVQLDYRQCQQGMELEVESSVGEWLSKRGIAEAVLRAVPTSATIQAEEGSVEKATQDLESYRDKQKRKSKSASEE